MTARNLALRYGESGLKMIYELCGRKNRARFLSRKAGSE
jgi:hypothetical protein